MYDGSTPRVGTAGRSTPCGGRGVRPLGRTGPVETGGRGWCPDSPGSTTTVLPDRPDDGGPRGLNPESNGPYPPTHQTCPFGLGSRKVSPDCHTLRPSVRASGLCWVRRRDREVRGTWIFLREGPPETVGRRVEEERGRGGTPQNTVSLSSWDGIGVWTVGQTCRRRGTGEG